MFPLVQISAHQRNMPGVVRKALDEAGMDMSRIDGIAFTQGPGIGGCLNVCSTAAKVLGATLGKPVIGVHHLQAHALAALIPSLYTAAPGAPPARPPWFPFLAVVATSTHTLVATVSSPDSFRILASPEPGLGEAFDTVARTLALRPVDESYGAALEAFCETGAARFSVEVGEDVMPEIDVPPIEAYNVGRSGLMFTAASKAVSAFVRRENGIRWVGKGTRWRLARAFRKAVTTQVEERVVAAIKQCRKEQLDVKNVVLCGGVGSNMYLQQRLRTHLQQSFPKSPPNLISPPPHLCTDNAAMVAWAAMHRFERQDFDPHDVSTRPKWKLEDYSGRALSRQQWQRVQAALKRPPSPTG